ncbi:MAG: class B sortase [Clostridia bacterium]|nr:class B sortase [Clostridia bacterium]
MDNAVLLTLLVCLMFAAYALWDTHQMLAAADANNYATYKPTNEETKSFEEFRAMNNDVIGWLTIYDTTIDYPVVRSPKSNDDYLSKNPEGDWEGSGSLFLDHNNKADFSDFNTIIFGHHMAGPAMFGEIDEFLNKDFFDKHEYANLFFSEGGLELVQTNGATGLTYEFVNYQGRNHGVQIFAMIQADGHDSAIYSVPSTTVEAKRATLQKIADYAVMVRNLQTGETRQLGKAGAAQPTKTDWVDPGFFGVTENDHIVLMSTCSADITNGRFVLVGKILDYEVPNPFPEEEKEQKILGIDVGKVLDTILKLPLWQWIILLILLIMLIGLLYYAERQRLRRKRDRKLRKLEEQKAKEEQESEMND